MELLKDYDCTNQYHPSKANVVIDALSRNSSRSFAHINKFRIHLIIKVHYLVDETILIEMDDF